MTDAVHVDKASLDALTETLRVMSARVATLETEKAALETEKAALAADNAKLRAILAQHGLSTADEATEPEDVCGEQSSAR